MTRSRRFLGTACFVTVLLCVSACALEPPSPDSERPAPRPYGGSPTASPSSSPNNSPLPTEAQSDATTVLLAPGVTLRAGADGTLPVRLRWIQPLDAPETIAVDHGVVYVVDDYFRAFRVADGALVWEVSDPEPYTPLSADGEVTIGREGTETIRAVAPWNYDMSVDRSTGVIRHFSYDARPGAGKLRPLPEPKQTRWRVQDNLRRMVARRPNGRIAWSIQVDEPMFGVQPVLAVPGGIIVCTTSGDLIALDYV